MYFFISARVNCHKNVTEPASGLSVTGAAVIGATANRVTGLATLYPVEWQINNYSESFIHQQFR
jgi:hypothetical protein